uniref:Anaphase-promoting complex subunit 5 n=1 Tax=Trichuris muris TaxID=70415 RepID=A0A5S6QJN8_TRIMR
MLTGELDDVLLEPLRQAPDLFDNETLAALSQMPAMPGELSPSKICVFILVHTYYFTLSNKNMVEKHVFVSVLKEIIFKRKGGRSFSEMCNFLATRLSDGVGACFVAVLNKAKNVITKSFGAFFVKMRCFCCRLLKNSSLRSDDFLGCVIKDFGKYFWNMPDLALLSVTYECFRTYVNPRRIMRITRQPEKIAVDLSDSDSDDCGHTSGFDSSSSLSIEFNRYHVRSEPKIPVGMFARETELFAREQIAHIRLGTGQAYPFKLLDDWLLAMRNRYSRLYSLRYLHFLNSMRILNAHVAEIDLLESCSKIHCPEYGEDERAKGPKSRRRKFAPTAAIVQKFIFRAELMLQCGRRQMAKQLYSECLRASAIRHNNRMVASCLFPLTLLETGLNQVACFKSLLVTMKMIPSPGIPVLRFYIKHWLATIEIEHMLPTKRLNQLIGLAEEANKLMKTKDVFNDAPHLAMVANVALSSHALLCGNYEKANDLWINLQVQRANSTLATFLQGDVKAARKSLRSLKLTFREYEQSCHWRKCEASMDFASSYFKQDNAGCRDSLITLATFCPVEAKLKECALLLSNGEIGECQKLLVHIRNDCEEKRIYLFRWLLLAAETAGYQCGDTERMSSYVHILRQISVHQNDTNVPALIGLLQATIHLLRGDGNQLVLIGLDTLRMLDKRGSAFEQGQCRFLLSVGYLLEARQAVEAEEKEKALNTSAEHMTEAASLFGRAEAPYYEKVAVWYLAQTYHALGRWKLRNQKAETFLLLDEAHPGDCHMQFLAKALLVPK